MRQIHWAKTALYDKLVSYDREGLAVSDATITLDTRLLYTLSEVPTQL